MTEVVADAAIFERDEYACQQCGATGADASTLTTWSIDSHPVRSSLVTLCSSCGALLDGADPTWRSTLGDDVHGSLFSLLETTTATQGATVAAIARLATDVTGGPESADESDPPTGRTREAYLATRRDVYRSLAVVDRHLDALADVSADTDTATPFDDLDPSVRSRLETVDDLMRTLRTHLRSAVVLAETAVVADGRCQVCLEPIAVRREGDDASSSDEPDRCGACSNDRRAIDEWETTDGEVDRTRLFRALSNQLEAAGETTTELTDETGTLAARLAG
ncbi:HNH endonuclease [Halovivax limisalsi]|uniref:HNH endonuclease n=1 Tax=Halovivax limisalsi TaxID=1453760 RepID=UPI001FFC72CD|nr:hypothetical protein [Halovivax limisalsi]